MQALLYGGYCRATGHTKQDPGYEYVAIILGLGLMVGARDLYRLYYRS